MPATMTVATIARPASLVEEVSQRLADELRRSPESEWLPPERTLALQLGVSRTVVREATKRLEQQGLLEVQHGIGIRRADRLHKPLNGSLALLIPDEVERLRQSLEVRLAIEPQIAALAATRAKSAQIRELRKIHSHLQASGELSFAVEADIEFHRALARASGNEVFGLILETLTDLGRESRQATISYAGVERAVKHHEAILLAVESHDVVGAEKAMKRHIEIAVLDLAGKLSNTKKSKR
jgi:GntR family transcriptional repressor for pyruvate dehydrogenase complex